MIPLSKLWITSDETIEVRKVLNSGWLTRGTKNQELEELVSNYLGVRHVICVSSCTAALHLALLSLELPKGEVLVSDYTFPASGHSVIHSGHTPVFVDINSKDYNMDYKDLERKITNETRAIMVVHAFGLSADMSRIRKIAGNIPIIEDAACALGSKYRGKFCGTLGEIGCFSLHATKGVGVGEGGLLVTNNNEVAEKVRKLLNFGRNGYVFEAIGFNYKLSDVSAAIGIVQFKKLDKIIKKKNMLAGYYNKKLKEIDWITPPHKRIWDRHNYQSYCCLVSQKIDRDKIIQEMGKKGIECQIGTFSSYLQPCYNNKKDDCIVSLYTSKKAIRLPMFYEMGKEDIDFIVNELKNCVR